VKINVFQNTYGYTKKKPQKFLSPEQYRRGPAPFPGIDSVDKNLDLYIEPV
jgi:hypothetical protein